MNTRNFLIGAALAGLLGCTGVNAQVLGGGLGGGLISGANGGLSGGLRDLSVTGAGSAAGSFGADLETQTLRHATRDTTQRTVGRVRETTQDVRGRTQSTLGEVRDATSSVAVDAAASATATIANAANRQGVGGAEQFAGSAASSVAADSTTLASASQLAVAEQASEAPAAPAVSAPPADDMPAAAPSVPLFNAAAEGSGSTSSDISVAREGASARSSFAADAAGEAGVSADR